MTETPMDFEAELRKFSDSRSVEATAVRLMWLRSLHRGCSVVVEPVLLESDRIVVRALISLADGTGASGMAVEHGDLNQQTVERAEWHAIARALDMLGVLAPSDNSEMHTDETAAGELQQISPSAPPVVGALRRVPKASPPEQPESRAPEVKFTIPTPFPRKVDADAHDDQDENLADISWTAFWRWARNHGLTRKVDIEQRIGREVGDLQPWELRQLLQDAGYELD